MRHFPPLYVAVPMTVTSIDPWVITKLIIPLCSHLFPDVLQNSKCYNSRFEVRAEQKSNLVYSKMTLGKFPGPQLYSSPALQTIAKPRGPVPLSIF